MFLGNLPFKMAHQSMLTLVQRYPKNELIFEGLLSGMEGREEDLMLALIENIDDTQTFAGIAAKMNETAENKAKLEQMAKTTNHTIFTDQMTKGLTLYRAHCATCHGVNGQGVDPLAPPLYDSEYVSGPKDRLVLIALHGMQGPVHVNGKLYEMSAVMPGIANSPELSDEDIVSILNFVRNAFSTSPRTINTEDIARLRGYTPAKGMMTEPELLAIE
jgi:mono/diheme cytochrome c family protein